MAYIWNHNIRVFYARRYRTTMYVCVLDSTCLLIRARKCLNRALADKQRHSVCLLCLCICLLDEHRNIYSKMRFT